VPPTTAVLAGAGQPLPRRRPTRYTLGLVLASAARVFPKVAALDSSSVSRPVIIRRPNSYPGPAAALRALAAHTDLLATLTAHRIRVRYKQSVLGLCWAVLQPVALMLIFSLVFGRIARVPSEGVPYPLFVYSGLLVWSFVSTGLSNATHALVAHAQLITKVYFPREILPLTYVAAGLFDLCVGAVVLAGLLVYHGHALTWRALYALPVLLVLTALVTAAAFLLSAIQVWFRDVGIAIPLILYLWMFSTPVAYPLSAVPKAYQPWFLLNPMTGIVESFRGAVIHGAPLEWHILAVPLVTAVVLLPLAYAFFKSAEATMADVI
jgi:lipopolysaccharide transport system permease protein